MTPDTDWRLLHATPHKRVYCRYEYLGGDRVKRVTRVVYDGQPALDAARSDRDRTEGAHGADIRLARKVPEGVLAQAIREGWDDAAWKRWANDADNRRLRVWDGNL